MEKMTVVSCFSVVLILFTWFSFCECQGDQIVINMNITEEQEPGTLVGTVKQGQSPYTFLERDDSFSVDLNSGEIRTSIKLDREAREDHTIGLMSTDFLFFEIKIRVLDINDNTPYFPNGSKVVPLSESSPQGSKIHVGSVVDRDAGQNGISRYIIEKGNEDGMFELDTKAVGKATLYLDLKIIGKLDYELERSYNIVIAVYDGGQPPRKGIVTVLITVLDANDNEPRFTHTKYSAKVPENTTVGTSILAVSATDLDSGQNGNIRYLLDQSRDPDRHFDIDPINGTLRVNKPLDYETTKKYELKVIARDNGSLPLETTAVVEIIVENINELPANINLVFLGSNNQTARVPENASVGQFVARISVSDPDSPGVYYSNVNVTLQGGQGYFGLKTQDNVIYLVLVKKALDRETIDQFPITIVAVDSGNPPLHASRSFTLYVDDVNDNRPVFKQDIYHAEVQERSIQGSSVITVQATDADAGINKHITYRIVDTPGSPIDWFQIDPETGLITTKDSNVDCEQNPNPVITVVAVDSGTPSLSGTCTVSVTVRDVNDLQPVFDPTTYSAVVREDAAINSCFLKVTATDPDCHGNAHVTYSLSNFSSASSFYIKQQSGELCIAKTLDFEKQQSYEFTALAVDSGGLDGTAIIKVTVTDVNDNPPIFYPKNYSINVDVTQANTGHQLVQVQAQDDDSGANSIIRYLIINGNNDNKFSINPSTGQLSLAADLQREEKVYVLEIEATDGLLRSSPNAMVYISVTGASHHPPNFEKATYRFTIREDVPRRTPVGSVKATVPSSGSSDVPEIYYTITDGDINGYFRIDQLSGEIRTNIELDHDKHPFILLNVKAGAGNPPVYGNTQVNISITDVNDNYPKFISPYLEINIFEDEATSTTIYSAHASDDDSGVNSMVKYKLLENPDNKFRIDQVSGEIRLETLLDYETVKQYKLVICAYDQGVTSLSSSMTLIIHVANVNDNPPVFMKQLYEFNVNETTVINTNIGNVHANDRDLDQVTYSLTESSGEVFGIFATSGFIYLRQPLDRESKELYLLTVIARDNNAKPSLLSSSAQVRIHITDANDNIPVFTEPHYEFHIQENLPTGTTVGFVSAVDQDSGENALLRYSIVGQQTVFVLNPYTGEISTNNIVDRERHPEYTFSVVVTDKGSPPRNATVNVKVIVSDVNDNAPAFQNSKPIQATVDENKKKGTSVIMIRAVDTDAMLNGTVSYFLEAAEDKSALKNFNIHPKTGLITTAEVLDFEKKRQYSLVVVARDSGTPMKESKETITIHVNDDNDETPIFSSISVTFRVVENTPVGSTIGKVEANDSDSGENGRVSYYIIAGNVFGLFVVNVSTGAIYCQREIDYEESSSHVIGIKAVDNNIYKPRSSTISVNIQIIDVNDNAPKFDKDPVILVRKENLPVGHVIHTFTATDKDSGLNGTVEYILMDQKPALGLLTLNPQSGKLTVNKIIDYEQVNQISLIVRARDSCPRPQCQLHSTITVMIFIQDENDNAPVFPAYSPISVKEDREIDYPVITIIAVDGDSNVNNSGFGIVSYEIVDGNQDNKFSIDTKTGILRIKQPLDREIKDRYVLNISASDHGSPRQESFTSLIINVEDVNDNAPHFVKSTYKANVTENGNLQIHLVTLSAQDQDIGNNGKLTYFLPSGVADGKFEIESTTGVLSTTVVLDREEMNSYIITAYVKDGGNPMRYDTATVIINVTDTNDNAPEFEEKVVALKIPENTEQADVHMAVAGDRDIGENAKIVYSIIGGNEDQMFSIHPETGRLSCKQLDREGKQAYNLTIMGRDLGQPSRPGYCNVLISVTDQNDNNPQFVQNTYSYTLREDVAVGSMVLQVSATDADEGSNGHVTYSLGNDTDGLFQVDSESGNITTNRAFDREKNSSITFIIIAKDGGLYDIRNATARVTVKITDVNDNYPIFQQIPYRKNLSAGLAANQHVIKVMADDKDEGQNGKVLYSIANSNFFRIDEETGDIFTSQTLGNNARGYHNLKVIAADHGTPPLSSEGVVEIYVGLDTGATSLRFRNQTYYRTLQENSAANTFVQLVTAEFVGTGTGTISYSIVSGNPETAFRIDTQTGNIYVKDPTKLDYEQSPTMHVFLAASSGIMFAYATLVVNLQDINDNAPRFAQDRYYTSTWEEQKINTFVTQVMAVDLDSGQNAVITYNIISGDDDRVFDIFPPHSGIVRTKFPLDFETRKSYRLVIEAVDHGFSPKSGTCILKVDVVDINDQAPKFPNSPPVNISEGREVGAFVAQITANDVDKNSILLYDFGSHGNPDNTFSIDRLSGRLTLAKKLDRESRSHYDIGLVVNDTKFAAMTVLRVNVDDINDNAPVFMQQSYQKTLEEMTPPNTAVITVNATDADAGVNAKITYKMDVIQTQGFRIDQQTGTIYTSQTVVYNPDQQIILIVKAEDGGVPPMSSVVAVHIQITRVNRFSPVFSQSTYRRSISEDARKGISVLKVTATDQDENEELDYNIISQGPSLNPFQIDQKSGTITLSGNLDRDTVPEYRLVVGVTDHGTPVKSSSADVIITIDDVNDQAPYFEQKSYYAELNESYPSEHTFLTVRARDNDIGPNAEIQYTITSGNDDGLFIVHGKTGDIVIMSNMSLDYERNKWHKLIVCATDCPKCPSTVRKLSAFVSVTVNVTDVNDHSPVFHVPFYYSSVYENQTENTRIFQAHAIDKDGGEYGVVTYQLLGSDLFKINKTSGWVSTNFRFDYENLRDLPPNTFSYRFRIRASDISGNTAEVVTVIRIKDLDESDPKFTKKEYSFTVRGDAKVGTVIGRVVASDNDKGEAGRIYYSLTNSHDYFDIETTKGDVFVKRGFSENVPAQNTRIKRALSTQEITLVIEASAGMENSRSSTAYLNIEVDESCAGCQIQPQTVEQGSDSQTTIILVIVFVILAVILIIVIVLLLIRNRFRKAPKTVAQVYEGAFDEGFDFPHRSDAPPAYDDVRHTSSEIVTTPDVSERSHNSASSGRGSVEVDDDEEICMINSNSSVLNQSSGFRSKNMPDSGIQDDENTSEPSIQNSKDYLARLGIDTSNNPIKTKNIMQSVESMHQFSDEGGGEDGLDIDYNKLVQIDQDTHGSDVNKDLGFHEPEPQHSGSLSSVINSEEEYSGSYNWDYLLDWGPQYQPLADVFSEIARLKDDSIQPKKQPIRTVPQRVNHTSLQPQVKMYPPPVITNAPPVEVVQQTANRSSHGGKSARTTSAVNSSHGGSNKSARTTSTMNTSLPSMPRSPISYESSFTSPALTPSFTPSLSPLATRSPSISPVVSTQGIGSSNHSSGHNTPRQHRLGSNGRMVLATSSESEQELRI